MKAEEFSLHLKNSILLEQEHLLLLTPLEDIRFQLVSTFQCGLASVTVQGASRPLVLGWHLILNTSHSVASSFLHGSY